ncbi:MAG TPA: DNA-processing protein DprA, partial [Kofleriaceae bacterium]|nr:DNA-processing protein DprA [Kofleriaceae bacterium]
MHLSPTTTIELADPRYPRRLAAAERAPAVLHAAGDLTERPLAVAIVGARAATGRGMVVARELARQVAAAGGTVVSG